jgi:hypothetical protein
MFVSDLHPHGRWHGGRPPSFFEKIARRGRNSKEQEAKIKTAESAFGG